MSSINGSGSWSFSADSTTQTGQGLSGGRYTLSVVGTFGSGTCKWQRSVNNGTTYVDIVDATGTANYEKNIECGNGLVRPSLSGSSSPTLTAYCTPIND